MAEQAARAAAPDGATDEEIVRRVLEGDVAAFELLVRRHGGRVHRTVRAILRSRAEIEDAIQQVYLQAFAGLRRFAGASTFATWLTRIAINEARSRVRRSARRPIEEAEAGSMAPRHDAGPEQETASREAAGLVERAARLLPPHYRTALALRHVEGLSIAETASRLGITESAAKLRIHRARLALRRAVDDSRLPGDGRRGTLARGCDGCSTGHGHA